MTIGRRARSRINFADHVESSYAVSFASERNFSLQGRKSGSLKKASPLLPIFPLNSFLSLPAIMEIIASTFQIYNDERAALPYKVEIIARDKIYGVL